MEKTVETSSSAETENVGAAFASELQTENGKTPFVAFFGDLGAGKTAFIRGMGRVICPDENVCSPTYAVINEYVKDGKTVMCHVDAYRIRDDDDLYSTGFYDYADRPGCVVCVEWSENIPEAVPYDAYKVRIEKISDEKRKIIITVPEGS